MKYPSTINIKGLMAFPRKARLLVYSPPFLFPVFGAFVWFGTHLGLYSKDTGMSVTLFGGTIILAALICWTKTVINKAEQEQQNAQFLKNQMAAIVQFSEDAIISKDLNGKIISWNEGAKKIYGYEAGEVLGKSIEIIFPHDLKEDLNKILKRIQAGEHIDHYETTRQTKEGKRINVSVTISPIKNADGKIIGASAIARNISDRKTLEEQLQQAQKMEAVGQLVGGIAHDFNNLLTVINGYADIGLQESETHTIARSHFKEISSAGRRAAALTFKLLGFSRRQIMKPQIVDLNHLIIELDRILKRLITENIEFVTVPALELKMVKVDPHQMEQVLVNLVVNARDAMPNGGRLVIETQNAYLDENYCQNNPGLKPGHFVMLAVSDTGSGMTEDVKRKAFEPFFTTKEPGKGTGLGLSTCYGIIKQNNGHIAIYSEPGHGTCFKLYLPQSDDQVETLGHETKEEPLMGGTETIIVVEDEPLLRNLAKCVLQKHGYTALEAENGEEALKLIHSLDGKELHLVITDIIMPRMGGKELVRNLKQIKPKTKVLYASGYTMNVIDHHGVLDADINFLQKPYVPTDLVRTVRKVLDEGKSPTSLLQFP